MAAPRRPLTQRKVFLMVSLADVVGCQALLGLGMARGIWLLNLPATITFGRLGEMVGGDALAMAVTIPAGAAIYGWAGARLHQAARQARPAA